MLKFCYPITHSFYTPLRVIRRYPIYFTQYLLYMICLIDDDQIFHITSRRLLQRAGYTGEILSFTSAEEAIQYFKKLNGEAPKQIQGILLDIHMPLMDGWEFIENCQSLALPEVPIYLVSSSTDERDRLRAANLPRVKGFFSKPLDAQKIVSLCAPPDSPKEK